MSGLDTLQDEGAGRGIAEEEPPLPAKVGIVDVLYIICDRGFLRAATRLSLTSKAVGKVAMMGTGRQIYEAAKAGDDDQLRTYLEYWRGNSDGPEVLNWAPMVPGAPVAVLIGKLVHEQFEDSPLRAAVMGNYPNCVQLLISCAPAVDVNKGRHTNPLHYACRLGRSAPVRALLTAPDIKINKKSSVDRTPLHEAADNGHADIVRMLAAVKGIELLAQDADGLTPLDLATEGQHQEVVAILQPMIELQRALNRAGRSLWYAADQGEIDELRSLVEIWSGNEYVLNWYDDVLYALEGCSPFAAASKQGHLEVVRLLASTPGVDINKVDDKGSNAIMMSAKRGMVDVVHFLLTLEGLDINKRANAIDRTKKGKSALGLAKKRGRDDSEEVWAGKQEIAAMLRGAGAAESEAGEEEEEEEEEEEVVEYHDGGYGGGYEDQELIDYFSDDGSYGPFGHNGHDY